MRREAQRRVQEMQRRTPGARRTAVQGQTQMPSYVKVDTSSHKSHSSAEMSRLPFQPPDASDSVPKCSSTADRSLPFLPTEFLSRLDSDAILIIALMVMLYKDGGAAQCDKKLLMALAYLLT